VETGSREERVKNKRLDVEPQQVVLGQTESAERLSIGLVYGQRDQMNSP
jgi:hypothetical protein